MDVQTALDRGYAALRVADWVGAKTAFEAALRISDTPEAHDGLGIALWWLNEIESAHEQRMAAFNGFKARGDIERAAVIACWLAREQIFFRGSVPAMQGWFARAARLLEQIPAASTAAVWCRLMRASVVEPPEMLEHVSLESIRAAASLSSPSDGDANLEAFALAFCGMAQVSLGRVGEGIAHLDEAMTMTTSGEAGDFMVISEVFCVMLSACDTAGDLARSEYWCDAAAEFAERHHCPFLSAYCRTTYGALMTALGRWGDAETALMEAISAFDRGHRGLKVHAVIRLADLRVSQGRYDEAETLLAGLEDQGAARVPLARLHVSKGEIAHARAVLEQGLDAAPTLQHLPLLNLLADVLVTMNEIEAATRVTDDLLRIARESGSDLLAAQAELAKGRIHLHVGALDDAKARLNDSLRHLHAYEQSLLAGQIRLEMARTLQANDRHGAAAWAKAALATFDRIGARRDALEAAKLLRELGASSGTLSNPPRLRQPLTAREQEILTCLAQGLTNREIAARLVISAKTVEHHVSSILGKLHLRSRAEAAALAASGRLNDPRSPEE